MFIFEIKEIFWLIFNNWINILLKNDFKSLNILIVVLYELLFLKNLVIIKLKSISNFAVGSIIINLKIVIDIFSLLIQLTNQFLRFKQLKNTF